MKKGIVLLVVLATTLLVAAPLFAGGGQEAPAPQAQQQRGPSDYNPFGAYDPAIDVSYHGWHQPFQQFLEGESFEDNLWTRLYAERLGVNLSFPWSAQSGDAYRQRLNISIATGQLADIFLVDSIIFGQLVEDDRLAPLDDAWNYMSDEGRAIMEWSPVTREAGTREGVLWGIAEARGPEGKALWVRQDWLDALGLDAPTTVDEFVEVARAFTFDDPDGNGQDDTIGFGISNELDDALEAWFSGFGGYPVGNYWVEVNGELEYGAIQPGVRDGLEVLQAMYDEGIVDREFGVKGEGELYDDIAAGRVGMYAGYFWSPLWPLNNLKGEQPDTEWTPIQFPSPSGELIPEALDLTPGEFWAARDDFAHPEVIIKMMNLFVEMQNTEPSYFNQVNEETGEVIELFHLAVAQYNTWRNNIDAALAIQRAIPAGEILPEHGVSPASMFGAEQAMLYATGQDTGATPWAYHKVFADGGSMNLVIDRMENDGYLENAYFGPPGEAWLRHGQSIGDLIEEWYVKFVTGEESLDDWDAFIEAFNNIGGAAVTAEVNEWYANR